MKAIQISENIYWVGAIDWRLRNFHGYLTQRGSTYNAYLIIDEKITLIDTVKEGLYEEMMERIGSVIDPSKIDYIISNHVEMDHSGSLPILDKLLQGKTIFASPNGVLGLQAHFGHLNLGAKKTGDTLNIGKRTLHFVNTPMVHWPDNMVTWSPEDKILFSNDAFGQHLATSERFADECSREVVYEESKKYYANIVLPYDKAVARALKAIEGLPIEIIAPAHGVVWRGSDVVTIVNEYHAWCKNETQEKALVVYDTMWGSTEKMANALVDMFEERGIGCQKFHLQDTHMSDIMTALIDARYICVGSPTLNNGMLPTVAAFLTYMKGLAPRHRHGVAFGSYGWGGHGIKEVNSLLENCKIETFSPLSLKFIPSKESLAESVAVLTAELDELLG